MTAATLRPEERIGLVVAIAAHAALFAWLAWAKPAPPPLPPERMTVTLSEDVGLNATSPNPAPEPAPNKGPELGEAPPKPEPVVKVEPPRPEPPKPRETARPQPRPSPQPVARPTSVPPRKAPVVPARATPSPAKAPPRKAPGASSFDNAFGPGVNSARGKAPASSNAAPAMGPQQQSALRAAIMRQIKPHWSAPQGIDAELLVSVVRFRLDQNGRLVGEPELISQQTSVTNRPQARRHFEQAVRAIKLAQPFILPPEFYSYWQTVTSTFDKRLSQ